MGGVERHGFTSQEWKRSFSLTPQDGFLFSQSIRENIELGKNAHSTYSLEDVGALSGFSKDLPQIKEGYEALLGERGINLSGGQRQRVGLARAMLAGSSILCLDDTLSALDTETESEILSNLKNQFEAKTLVVVSHRYSSVSHCDHIIFLNNGAIAEQGTHEELIRQDGLYAKVYRKQKLTQDLEET
jgi:ATP-binding cassette subfamily B protein